MMTDIDVKEMSPHELATLRLARVFQALQADQDVDTDAAIYAALYLAFGRYETGLLSRLIKP